MFRVVRYISRVMLYMCGDVSLCSPQRGACVRVRAHAPQAQPLCPAQRAFLTQATMPPLGSSWSAVNTTLVLIGSILTRPPSQRYAFDSSADGRAD